MRALRCVGLGLLLSVAPAVGWVALAEPETVQGTARADGCFPALTRQDGNVAVWETPGGSEAQYNHALATLAPGTDICVGVQLRLRGAIWLGIRFLYYQGANGTPEVGWVREGDVD